MSGGAGWCGGETGHSWRNSGMADGDDTNTNDLVSHLDTKIAIYVYIQGVRDNFDACTPLNKKPNISGHDWSILKIQTAANSTARVIFGPFQRNHHQHQSTPLISS